MCSFPHIHQVDRDWYFWNNHTLVPSPCYLRIDCVIDLGRVVEIGQKQAILSYYDSLNSRKRCSIDWSVLLCPLDEDFTRAKTVFTD
jgi:hypothetical protein